MANVRPTFELLQDRTEIADRTSDWDGLAESVSESNPFFESWFVNAAMQHLESADVRIAFVYRSVGTEKNGSSPGRELIGVFPLQLANRYKGLPLTHWKPWKHDYCFLCTPLLRRGCEDEAISGLIAGLRAASGPGLIEFGFVAADGSVFKAITHVVERERAKTLITDQFERAILRIPVSYETYFRETFDGKRRKELTRQSNRLAERGAVEVDTLQQGSKTDIWLDDFLKLEASGWKGKEQTAFASNDADRAFFRAIASEAHRRDRLMMLALRVDKKPIAMKFNLLAGDAAFAFKIAFDEEWSAFSPGMRLEMENVRTLCEQKRATWLDGCADADHFMANRIWPGRRKLASMLVSLKATGAAAIQGLRLAQGFRKHFGTNRSPERGVPS